MTVYVDNMRESRGSLIFSYMIADTEEELLEMANKIGVASRWHRYPDTYRSRFYITLSKRRLAIANGAVAITWRELSKMLAARKPKRLRLPRKGGTNDRELPRHDKQAANIDSKRAKKAEADR